MKGKWKKLIASLLCGMIVCTNIESEQIIQAEAAEMAEEMEAQMPDNEDTANLAELEERDQVKEESGEEDTGSLEIDENNGSEKQIEKSEGSQEESADLPDVLVDIENEKEDVGDTENIIASGVVDETYGQITWIIDQNGKLTVTGTGDLATVDDQGNRSMPWSDYCTQISSAKIDVTEMKDASYLFYNCNNLQELDLSGFDTSQVTNMESMFAGCSSLIELNLSNFDTSQVSDMSGMFAGCINLRELDLSNFNTGHLTVMTGMVRNCKSLNKLDLSSFDTSQVTEMSFVFGHCEKLVNLNLSGFDTSNVSDMEGMFSNCDSLISLDLSNWNTAKVTNMSYMFEYCKNLKELNVDNFDTSQVTTMDNMFTRCESLIELDLSSFDTSNITSYAGMRYMFEYCRSLVKLDISNFTTSQITNMDAMFGRCNSLLELDLGNFDTSNVTNMDEMFVDCNKLTKLNVSNFNTSKVTNMASMFAGCNKLTELNVNNFDTSKVTNMAAMFGNCQSLTKIDISNFDTRRVTNMGNMFGGCSSLTELDLSSFNTSNVRESTAMVNGMRWMFQDCSSLTKIDLSSFDTSNVTHMGEMFRNCSSLTELDLSNFDTSKVTNMQNMFINCTNLKRIKTPINVHDTVSLSSENVWYYEDGLAMTEDLDITQPTNRLPMNLNYSITMTKDEIPTVSYPYITAKITTPFFYLGSDLNLKYMHVIYYKSAGDQEEIFDFTTNAKQIDMSVPGRKELIVTYNTLTATVNIIVASRAGEELEERRYTVTFDLQGHGQQDAYPAYTDIIRGDKILEPHNPLDPDYKFTGWYKDPACSLPWNFSYDVVESDLALYAGWKKLDSDDESPDDPSEDDVSDGIWITEIEECTYTGSAIEPEVQVYNYNRMLVRGRDYTVSYKNNRMAADVSEKNAPRIIVKGKGNYAGTFISLFTIKKAVLTEENLIAASIYPAKSIYVPVVMLDSNILKAKTDYSLTYQDAQGNPLKKRPDTEGNYYMHIAGKGSCTGEFSFPYTIAKEGGISIAKGKANVSSIIYGEEKPIASLTVDHKKLSEGIDYALIFSNTKTKGTATATFIGIGKYTGVLKKTFKVKAATLPDDCISVPAFAVYEKGGAKPEVIVTVDGKELAKDVDYTVSYKKNTKLNAMAQVIVKGKGNYRGSQSASFKVQGRSLTSEGIYIYISDAVRGKKPSLMIYDRNGKKLASGNDYKAKIDTVSHRVTITGGKNGLYTTSTPVVREYQELEAGQVITFVSLNKKSSDFPGKFQYALNGVVLDKKWLTVKAGKSLLKAEEFEIVEYINNVSKGTAIVIIQGIGKYSGTKALNIKIQPYNM